MWIGIIRSPQERPSILAISVLQIVTPVPIGVETPRRNTKQTPLA
jgi:hypothetical protein